MITRLRIHNFALISDLELAPDKAFNIITGETGAGKSIIIAALSLLYGKSAPQGVRASSDDDTLVEAAFNDPNTTISRIIKPSGRSKAFINGKPVSLAALGEAAKRLFAIHAQHDNSRLLDDTFQLAFLDAYALNADLLANYSHIWSDYRAALARYSNMRDQIAATEKDADYLQYLYAGLCDAQLVENEDVELEALLRQAESEAATRQAVLAAADALNSALPLLQDAVGLLHDAVGLHHGAAATSDTSDNDSSRLAALLPDIADITDSVNRRAANFEALSEDFDSLRARLDRLNALKARHKAPSVAHLIALRDDLALRLSQFHDAPSIMADLENAARAIKKQALQAAQEISQRRHAAADTLQSEIQNLARPLGMPHFNVNFNLQSGKLNPNGSDTLSTLFSFNLNQSAPHTPSGGEIARLNLVYQAIAAQHSHLPTLILDEVDTGVSGQVATQMGKLMLDISRHTQVIAISHLPAVAAAANAHFKVFKQDNENSTNTFIKLLTPDQRRAEIASLIAGSSDNVGLLHDAVGLLHDAVGLHHNVGLHHSAAATSDSSDLSDN